MSMREHAFDLEVRGSTEALVIAIDEVIASARTIRAEIDSGDIPTTAGAGSRLVASAGNVLRHLAELSTMRRLWPLIGK